MVTVSDAAAVEPFVSGWLRANPERGVCGSAGNKGRPARPRLSKPTIPALFDGLRGMYGPQPGWWPRTDGPIEVCAGAILVQHTTWASAARAIEALREAGALDCAALLALPDDRLEQLVRPAGAYRGKARTLRAFATTVVDDYGADLDALLPGIPAEVRARLLRIRGIGAETADAIVLYAAGLPAFIADAYAVRLWSRLDLGPLDPADVVRAAAEDVARLQEWHALIVEHGRRTCLARRPRCDACSLRPRCGYAATAPGPATGASAARPTPSGSPRD